METTNLSFGRPPCPETGAERQHRITWKAEQIGEARADGRLVSADDVKAWIDSIGSDHELPVPYSDA